MRLLLGFLVFILLLLFSTHSASAIYDPLSVTNNKYGIHIVDSSDLKDAANLVNSAGGDWGYFTIVIQQTQRDPALWQRVFDEARRLHLIPIVRLATKPVGNIWEKPSPGDIDGWVSFLSSLNWVIKNRYVVINNEPNHAKEWGGELNPEEYAHYFKDFSQKLKTASGDFFIIPAGLDASSLNSKDSMEESLFLKRMLSAEPDIFANTDGWASHSYPNPDFSGPENGSGRGSVRTFQWELSLLKNLGVGKDFPVFITETGWVHDGTDPEKLGPKYAYAFQNVWKDKNVVAITPFLLSYNAAPFDIFSWKDKNGRFYKFYGDVQALVKESGGPIQEDAGALKSVFVQPLHLTGAPFVGLALLTNEGQAIWKKEELSFLTQDKDPYEVSTWSFETLEPGSTGFIVFKGKTPESSGVKELTITISRDGKTVSVPSRFQLITMSAARMNFDSFFATIWRLFKGL